MWLHRSIGILILALSAEAASAKGKLADFVEETESVLLDSSKTLAEIGGKTAGDRHIASRPLLDAAGRLEGLEGRVREAIAGFSDSIDGAQACRLPAKVVTAVAVAKLQELLADADSVSSDLGANPGISKQPGYGELKAQLGVYRENLKELKAWLLSSKVEGPTSELIARHPACAGRVAAAGLLRNGAEQAESGEGESDSLGKIRIDLNISRVKASGPAKGSTGAQ